MMTATEAPLQAGAVTLRALRPEDLPAARALLDAAGLPGDDLRADLLDGFVLAERAGRLAGVAGVEVHGDAGLLRSVAVAEDARGTGLGGRLVDDRIAWARARRLRVLALLTTTAAAWFPRRGFRTVARAAFPEALKESSEFRGGCCASAAAQVLQLDEG